MGPDLPRCWGCGRVGAAGHAAGERRRAYAADVTYVTAKEAGFDHLRDLLATRRRRARAPAVPLRHRRRGRLAAGRRGARAARDRRAASPREAVVRARAWPRWWRRSSPACTSTPTNTGATSSSRRPGSSGWSRRSAAAACTTDANYDAVDRDPLRAARARPAPARRRLHRARRPHRDRGRVHRAAWSTDRHWPDGLQAALEAKEGLERRPDGRILGSMTLQHFLRAYPRLCGMTGTAQEAAREMRRVLRPAPWSWFPPTAR